MAADFALTWYIDEVDQSAIDRARITKFYTSAKETEIKRFKCFDERDLGQLDPKSIHEEILKDNDAVIFYIGSQTNSEAFHGKMPKSVKFTFFAGDSRRAQIELPGNLSKAIKELNTSVIAYFIIDTSTLPRFRPDQIQHMYKADLQRLARDAPTCRMADCKEYMEELHELIASQTVLILHFGSKSEYTALAEKLSTNLEAPMKIITADLSAYYQRSKIIDKLINELKALGEIKYDILYVVIDDSNTELIRARVFKSANRDEFEQQYSRHTSAIEKESLSKEDSPWRLNYLRQPYHGNFCIGLAMSAENYPIDVIMGIVALIPIQKYYIRVSTVADGPVEILKAAEMTMLIAR